MDSRLVALFGCAALMNAAMAAASAVSTLVADDSLGGAWAGLPNAAGVAGTGAGALLLTRVMARRGRRAGLIAGFSVAVAGAVLAAAAVPNGHVGLLTLGMALLGIGNSGAQLARYAAADLYPPQRRGVALGAVVWAGTAGAVGGPLLLMPAQRAAQSAGWAPALGPFLVAAAATVGALAAAAGAPRAVPSSSGEALRTRLFADRTVRTAAATMVTAQVVMVAVMTSAPLAMHHDGAGLGEIGTMLAAHTFGMFALAPLSGWLLDRVGSRPLGLAGVALLAGSAAFVATVPEGRALTGALFLLGYGWNLCIVAGSGLLSTRLPDGDVTRAQGAVEALSWGTSTPATAASTIAYMHGGYPVLATGAAAVTLVPLLSMTRGWSQAPGVQRPVPTSAVAE